MHSLIGNNILHYHILKKLGEGGMGVVYLAKDKKLDRNVAIKFLPGKIASNQKERARFEIEAKAAAALNHPNIATIHSIEETQEKMFIVMEYINGRELKEIVKKYDDSRMPVAKITSIAIQIANGLKAAHEKGIVHRDIKGANIMINADGHVKITDFGLAKIRGAARITRAGAAMGTAAFMSPEQCRMEDVDHRTDIWSFGIILYQMLSGRLPFEGDYEAAQVYAILHEIIPDISSLREDVPETLYDLVNKALQKDKEKRFQSFEEILNELNKISLTHLTNSGFAESQTDVSAKATAELSKGSRTRSDAERRNIAALYCDIERLTDHSEDSDPEELNDFLSMCQEVCENIINRFDGYTERYSNDHFLVYFGYPQSYENVTRRAVLAGLAIIDGLKELYDQQDEANRFKIATRIGIHNGLVLVKDTSGIQGEPVKIVGDTSGVARHLSAIADPNTVITSEESLKLIKPFFKYTDFGKHKVKGSTEPLPLFAITAESGAQTRLEAEFESGLTPLVGRAKEIDLLQSLWSKSMRGTGQAVFIQGEAGIGKSRMIDVVRSMVDNEAIAWTAECRCSPFHQSSSLFPVIQFLETSVLKFEGSISIPEKTERIESLLQRFGFNLPETAPFMFSLFGIVNEKYPQVSLTPEAAKIKTLEILISLLLSRAEKKSVLLIVDDLHWADPTTLDLINMLLDHLPTSATFALFTFRPEFKFSGDMRSHMNQISLDRLSHDEIMNMVERITNNKKLPESLLQKISDRTDGVPLFVEELTKMVLDANWLIDKKDHFEIKDELPQLNIPRTLADSLMARLDKMKTAKEVAQVASVLGREFSYSVLKTVSEIAEDRLQNELSQLIRAEILYRKGLLHNTSYIFKHALIQEAAYASLAKSTRQDIHQSVAETLEKDFSNIADAQPELIAHHKSEAGLAIEAIHYWQKAGLRDLQKSSNLEAISHLNKALNILKEVADPALKEQLELLVLTTLGPAVVATQGFGAEEVGKIYNRAGELSHKMGETPQLFPTIWGQWVYNLVRANLNKSNILAQELLDLGIKYKESSIEVEGHWTKGNSLFWLGRLDDAEKHLKQAVDMYDPEKHHTNAYIFGQDPVVAAHCYLTYTYWFQGYPDKALQETDKVLEIAEKLNHPFSIGWAMAFGMMVAGLRRDADMALERTQKTIEYCSKQAYPFWITASMIIQGWALSVKGNSTDGIALMRQGLAGFQMIGSEVVEPLFIGILAEILGENGFEEEALQILGHAIDKASGNKEKISEIDLHRIKGQILFKQSPQDVEQVQQSYERALNLARECNSRSRELQAAIALFRLHKNDEHSAQYRDQLAALYNWFSEGFETELLQEALLLLNESA